MITEAVPTLIDEDEPTAPRANPHANEGSFTTIYTEAERLRASGAYRTLADALDALGLDLDRAISLRVWEAALARRNDPKKKG